MNTVTVVPGRWRTRNRRNVTIDRSFEVEDSPQPGMPKVRRNVWQGRLFRADGHTVDSMHMWETDGRFRTPQGVATEYDLTELVQADHVPEAPAPAVDPEVAEGRKVKELLASVKKPGESDSQCVERLIQAAGKSKAA